MFWLKNHDSKCNYGFNDGIVNCSFTDLIIESDNLELFKLYAVYSVSNINYTLAKHGAIKILKYAHENGCRWDGSVCSIAAEYGHLECLRYAHENGCPWNTNTCSLAARYGTFRMFALCT